MIPVGAGLRTRVAFPRQQSCTRMHTISHPSISYTLYRWFTPAVFAASAWTLPFQAGLLSHALVRFALSQLAEACICSCVWMDVDAVVAATTAGQDAATPPSTHALGNKGLHFPCMRRSLPSFVSLLPSRACFHTTGPIGPPPPPRFEPELPSLLIGRFVSFRLGVSLPFEPSGRLCGVDHDDARCGGIDATCFASSARTWEGRRAEGPCFVGRNHACCTLHRRREGMRSPSTTQDGSVGRRTDRDVVDVSNVVLTTKETTHEGAPGKKQQLQNRTCQLRPCGCRAGAMHREERTGRPRGRKIRTLQKRRCIGVECDLGRHRRHCRGRRKGGTAWIRYV